MADEDLRVVAVAIAALAVVWPRVKSDFVASSADTQWADKDKVKV
jgi:hypothetical protein